MWFVATGSSETWLSGIHHLVNSHRLDRATTYFLDMDSVGAGRLRYTTGEGLMHVFRSSPKMLGVAESLASEFDATPHRRRGLPGDGLLPRIHGYRSLGLMGVESAPPAEMRLVDTDEPPAAPRCDTLYHVDVASIPKAAGFAEAILRRLSGGHA